MKRIVSSYETKEIRELCEDYLHAMDRLKVNNQKADELKGKMKGNAPDFYKSLYEREINALNSQIREDTESTGYFRWALDHLDEKDRSIMEQLYVEGYAWNSVIDEKGNVISPGTIGRARQRSFVKMAELIFWMKNEVVTRPVCPGVQPLDSVNPPLYVGEPSGERSKLEHPNKSGE